MRTPRTFAALAASTAALIFTPAFADPVAKTQQVEIEVDFSLSAADNYDRIRLQAWNVCKPELGSTYAAARNRVRRECQKQVIADAMQQLMQNDQIQLATTAEAETQ